MLIYQTTYISIENLIFLNEKMIIFQWKAILNRTKDFIKCQILKNQLMIIMIKYKQNLKIVKKKLKI